MDPKVYGKLLTHHRSGYGVDVEALRDRFPLRRSAGKGPRWDLTGTEGCGGGNRVSWCSWMFSGIWVYIGGRSTSVEQRGPHEGGGRAPYLVPSSLIALRILQVLWITFVPKITLPKVLVRLDSV